METFRLLLVEDNPIDAVCLDEALAEAGSIQFAVCHVETLAEAKERLAKEEFDAIVLDLGLPDSQGLTTFTQLQSWKPSAPIVVLSGLDDETLAQEAVRIGAQDYLVKDTWDGVHLSRAISYAIERQRLLVSLRETERLLRRSEEALRKTTRALQARTECNQALIHAREEPALLREICRIIVQVGGYRMAWIGFPRRDEAKTVAPVAVWGDEEGYLEAAKITWSDDETGRGPTGTAIRTRTIQVNRDGRTNPNYRPWLAQALKHGYASSISFPLIAEQTTFGSLSIYAAEPGAFDEEEVRLLSALAGDLSYGIASIRVRAEREWAQEELRQSERRFREFAQLLPEPAFETDLNGTITFANQRTLEVFGYGQQDLDRPLHMPDLFAPQDRGKVREDTPKVLNREDRGGIEYTCIRKDSTRFPAFIHTSAISRNDKVVGLTGIIIDLTERKKAEQVIREHLQFQQILMEAIPNPVFFNDSAGRLLGCNEAFSRLLGLSKEEIVGSNVYDLIPQYMARAYRAKDDALPRSDGAQTYESKIRYSDGKEHDVIFYKNTFPNRDGTVGGLIGTVLDITERKRAETALLKEKNFSNAMIDILPGTFYIFDDRGRLIRWNKNLEEMAEDLGGQISSMSPLDFFVRGDARKKVEEAIHRGFTEGDTSVEADVTTSDGRVTEYLFTARRVALGGKLCLMGIGIDITELKQAEQALKFERTQLLSIFDSINEMVLVIDPQSHEILYANKFTEDLYGKRIIGGKCYEKLQGADAPCMDCPDVKIMELQGKPYRWEFTKPLLSKHFLATDRMMRWPDGRDVRFQLAVDMTEARRAEQEKESLRTQLLQAQKMEAIGTLAGGIAHDFNNLLQVALGYSELLLAQKSAEDPDYADLLKIHRAARNGTELVQSLLTFSRRVEPALTPLDLNRQVTEVESFLNRTIPKMIDMRLELAGSVKRIHADATQIEQVLMNLAINARDAMPHGGTLTLSTRDVVLGEEHCKFHAEAQPGDYVLLCVADTGHGMDAKTLEHIFEPFFTTKELGRGTGLGLATVYGIVKQHGGHISCESEVGRGTTFKIYLPAIPQEAEPDVEPSGETVALGTETVLLVDDEEVFRELGERILTERGYTVLTASNGEEALDLYAREKDRIDLVILDLIMPTMGGKDCLKELLKVNPATRVLITSGYLVDASTKECIELGAKAFVAKPFRFQELLRQVRETLDESRLATVG